LNFIGDTFIDFINVDFIVWSWP